MGRKKFFSFLSCAWIKTVSTLKLTGDTWQGVGCTEQPACVTHAAFLGSSSNSFLKRQD